MGHGQALTGIVLGSTIITENAPITILRAPDRGRPHRAAVLRGRHHPRRPPASSFPACCCPPRRRSAGLVSIGVPLVPTLPGAPYISVISLHATLGPIGVTYYEQVGGRTLAYQPKGILLPTSCPGGGFPFAAEFRFLDNSLAQPTPRCRAQAPRGADATRFVSRREFPFAAQLSFVDGSVTDAHMVVTCPAARRRRRVIQ